VGRVVGLCLFVQSEVKAHRILPGTKEIKDIIAVLTLMGTQSQGQGGGQYGWW
jgi:hypothetical protein